MSGFAAKQVEAWWALAKRAHHALLPEKSQIMYSRAGLMRELIILGIVSLVFLAFDDDMKHVRGIFTSAATPNGTQLLTVINLDARKQ